MIGRTGRRTRLGLSLLSVGMTLLLFALVGFRGIGPEGLEFLETARALAGSLGTDATPTASGLHPFAHLVVAATMLVLPTTDLVAGWLASAVCVALAVPAVAGLGRRWGGRFAGAFSAVLFAGSPAVVAAGTTMSGAGAALLCWCWGLFFVFGQRRGTLQDLGIALAMAGLFLSWLPGAILLLVMLLLRGAPVAAESNFIEISGRGTTPALAFTPTTILVPVLAVGIATAVHPGFWNATLDAWTGYVEGILDVEAAVTWFGGEHYLTSRPPLYLGVYIFFAHLPAVLLAAAFGGIAMLLRADRTSGLTVIAAVIAIGLLPWLQRSSAYGDVSTSAVLTPLLAPLAGAFVLSVFRRLNAPGPRHRAIAVLFATTILTVPLVEGLLHHPFTETYVGLFGGGPERAAERGHDLGTSDIVPVSTVREALKLTDRGMISAGTSNAVVEEYEHAGLLTSPVDLAPPEVADAVLVTARGAMEIALPGVRHIYGPGGVPAMWIIVREPASEGVGIP